MDASALSQTDRQTLLEIARKSIAYAIVKGRELPVQVEQYSALLRQNGASFVTLTRSGRLRGCIGTLQAYQPLVLDVRDHAVQAALEDPRFRPVSLPELDEVRIEISRLTQPVIFPYQEPKELLTGLRPGEDGVVLRDGFRSATFLPQVWDQIPDPAEFLSALCEKMGAAADTWQRKKLQVHRYQVEEFSEGAL